MYVIFTYVIHLWFILPTVQESHHFEALRLSYLFIAEVSQSWRVERDRIEANFENIYVLMWKDFCSNFYICCTSMSYASNKTRITLFRGSSAELLIFSQSSAKLKSWERHNHKLTLKRYLYQSTKSFAMIFIHCVYIWVVFPMEE